MDVSSSSFNDTMASIPKCRSHWGIDGSNGGPILHGENNTRGHLVTIEAPDDHCRSAPVARDTGCVVLCAEILKARVLMASPHVVFYLHVGRTIPPPSLLV